MNPYYAEYIATAKTLAQERGLIWDLVCDEAGKVSKDTRWNLTSLVGMFPPPTMWLGQLGVEQGSFGKLNEIRAGMGQPALPAQAISQDWRDLYQAVLIHQLLIRRTKPMSASKVANPVRQLAPVAGDTPPWAVTAEQIQQAYNATLQSQESGKVALDFKAMVRNILDGQKLADTPALTRFCVPYATEESKNAQSRADDLRKRQNAHGGNKGLRRQLAERKTAAKLPDERAFWELVRIVFTENPRTFSDVIRFAALQLLIVMGFRIGETASLPLDWKRWREYVDADGTPAGKRGGVSRSLMIRHFAEKQEDDELSEGLALYENTQHVPPMYEEILVETLDRVAKITAPLRERLRLQTETGRIFPEYPLEALIPAWEMYVRMTGNALFSKAPLPVALLEQYRETYDPELLHDIRAVQLRHPQRALSNFWTQPHQRSIAIRGPSGDPFPNNIDWNIAHVRVGDVEVLNVTRN